jgi:hypothetical protein
METELNKELKKLYAEADSAIANLKNTMPQLWKAETLRLREFIKDAAVLSIELAQQEWELMLQTCIYTALLDHECADGKSISGKEKAVIVTKIIQKFKDKLTVYATRQSQQLSDQRM